MASSTIDTARRVPRVPLAPPPRMAVASPLTQLWPAVFLFYSLLVPPEVRVALGNLTFYPNRLVCLALTPWILMQMLKGRMRVGLLDYMVFIACFWMVFSFCLYMGFADGLVRGGALAIDVLLPYLIARLTIASLDDLRRFLILAAPGAFAAGFVMMVESITHVAIIRPTAARIFGNLLVYDEGLAVGIRELEGDFRFGLMRAMGPFSHPILAGVFLGSLFALLVTSSVRGWPRQIGILASFMSVFSVSTNALLVLVLSIILLLYDSVQRALKFLSWKIFLIFVGIGTAMIQALSEGGLIRVIARYSLNSSTAYNRIRIWEYGSASVAKYPWIGIGFDSIERPMWMRPSIDMQWLLLGVRHGFIVPTLLLLACIIAVVKLSLNSTRASDSDRRMYVGVAVSFSAMIIAGWSVAFFGSVGTWFWMMMGGCISLGAVASIAPQQPA